MQRAATVFSERITRTTKYFCAGKGVTDVEKDAAEYSPSPPLPSVLSVSRNGSTSFTWANYVGDEIRAGFENEFGVRVIVDVFASNEDLLAKLMSGASGYDVIMPSDYMVAIMIKEKLLAALDLSTIPNYQNISARFLGRDFDPENRYSIPYTWGTAGIGYDSSVVNPPPDSLSILWDKRYSGKFSMLDDQRETIGVALKLLGHSVNSTDLNALKAAKAKLIEQKPLVKQYKNEADEILGSGDVVMAHCWSGDAFRAAARRPNIKYVIPKEGATQFIDTVCIPASAPHKAIAAQFINYLLRPEINAKVTEFTKYGTCVACGRESTYPKPCAIIRAYTLRRMC